MTNKHKLDEISTYEIRVEGLLGKRWANWFAGFTIIPQPDGTTCLTGSIRDQAALHGLLEKIRDLGLILISLQAIETD
ncbi:MAG: hypothetical protein DRI56_13070 [Chloroflexota bacterium]|nr:MAG: hypothetical protein DRI56_13070 [Chloroflexota bacterium]